MVEVAKSKEAALGGTRIGSKGKEAGQGTGLSRAKPLLENKGLEASQGNGTTSKTKESEPAKTQAIA